MKKTARLFSLLCGLLWALLFTACGSSQEKELNRMLVELAAKDACIDRADWDKLSAYIDANKVFFASFNNFVDANGTIDEEAVKTYVTNFFANRRPPLTIRFEGVGSARELRVNFYLERSGSMTPYDAPGGDGSFKAAIVKMLNNLPGNNESHRIFVVNNSIEAYPEGVARFIADANIFEATRGIGDPSYTDFGAIFDAILNKTGGNELSILVTDMIYSTRSMTGVNPQKIFAEAQGMTQAVFKDEVKHKAMLIVKMEGSYQGPYYSYSSPTKGTAYSGSRPYYIVVVGSNENMARLTTDPAFAAFARFDELRGYRNMYLFDTDGVYHPAYSVLLSHTEKRGRYKPEHGQQGAIHNLESVETDPNSGDLRLTLAVDLSKMLIDKNYLTNPANYEIESTDAFTLKEIRALTPHDLSPVEKRDLPGATHLMVLEAKSVSRQQTLHIKLRNELPTWVAASSSDDDSNTAVAAFSQTTFGLKYLLQGIYDSYKRNTQGTPAYFDLELKLNR